MRVTFIVEREIRTSLKTHIKKFRLGSVSEFVARSAVKDMTRAKGSALVGQSRHLPANFRGGK